MATITQDLGKVAYLSKGAYSSSTQYEKNDVTSRVVLIKEMLQQTHWQLIEK